MRDEAIKKLSAPLNDAKLSRRGNLVSKHVIEALKYFCRQNNEFAQSIVQSDKTIAQCIEASVKGVTDYASDIEVYRRAAAFWFEGATIGITMTIDLGDGGFSNDPGTTVPEGTVSDTVQTSRKHGLSLPLDELLK